MSGKAQMTVSGLKTTILTQVVFLLSCFAVFFLIDPRV